MSKRKDEGHVDTAYGVDLWGVEQEASGILVQPLTSMGLNQIEVNNLLPYFPSTLACS